MNRAEQMELDALCAKGEKNQTPQEMERYRVLLDKALEKLVIFEDDTE